MAQAASPGAEVPRPPAPAARLKVVASFSILGDFVRQVGGERVDGRDPRRPGRGRPRLLADARRRPPHGRGQGGGRQRAQARRLDGPPGPVVRHQGAPRRGGKGDRAPRRTAERPRHGHDHGAEGVDPHAWQNVANAKVYVGNIRDALIAVDPDGRATYEANAAAYLAKLDALDARGAGRRRPHPGRPAQGSSPRTTPSPISRRPTASISSRRRASRPKPRPRQRTSPASSGRSGAEKIPAVFLENISDPRLIERIAKETGARIGGRLYSDALSGPGGPAATYIDMMRHNIRVVRRRPALRS